MVGKPQRAFFLLKKTLCWVPTLLFWAAGRAIRSNSARICLKKITFCFDIHPYGGQAA